MNAREPEGVCDLYVGLTFSLSTNCNGTLLLLYISVVLSAIINIVTQRDLFSGECFFFLFLCMSTSEL